MRIIRNFSVSQIWGIISNRHFACQNNAPYLCGTGAGQALTNNVNFVLHYPPIYTRNKSCHLHCQCEYWDIVFTTPYTEQKKINIIKKQKQNICICMQI